MARLRRLFHLQLERLDDARRPVCLGPTYKTRVKLLPSFLALRKYPCSLETKRKAPSCLLPRKWRQGGGSSFDTLFITVIYVKINEQLSAQEILEILECEHHENRHHTYPFWACVSPRRRNALLLHCAESPVYPVIPKQALIYCVFVLTRNLIDIFFFAFNFV